MNDKQGAVFDTSETLDAPPGIKDLLRRYGGNIPRYTSYPTAVQFTRDVDGAQVGAWLGDIPADQTVSLYFHVPFCDELCSFCACNTSVVRHDEIRSAYGTSLIDELDRIAGLTPKRLKVAHLHWGGGTPTTMPVEAMRRIMARVRHHYDILPDAEVSMELDPRTVPENIENVLAELGFNRVSFGVQDIEPDVQEACGRTQSLKQTKDCIDRMRGAGIKSVNTDLIYGLPRQTRDSIERTAQKIADLRPDRLAVFGYAHVPWMQKRQRLIDENILPDLVERLIQRQTIDRVLKENGYLVVGLDHYVLPTDSMAQSLREGTLHRNFQGYTTDRAEVLIGIGASGISSFPQGLSQNVHSAAGYQKALKDDPKGLPTWRGVERTDDDKMRNKIIERLMCDLKADLGRIAPGTDFSSEIEAAAPMLRDGILRITEKNGAHVFEITENGRPFVRNVASLFDKHLKRTAETPRHSSAI